MGLGGGRGESLLGQGAGIRTIQVRLGDIDVKTIWTTPIGCRVEHLGYEAQRTFLAEQRDLLQTAYQAQNQVGIPRSLAVVELP